MKKLLFFILHHKKILIIVSLSALVVGLLMLKNNKSPQQVELVQVKRQDLQKTISASGTIAGEETANLKFKSSGKLAYISAKVGEKVSKGEIIATLDTQDLKIALQQAQNTLADKQAAAQKVEDELKGHDKDETFEQKAKRTAAQAASNNAYDAVKEAQRAFQDTVLVTPITGIIIKADFLPGQFVSTSDQIVQIIDDSQVYFDAEIDESDIGQVKLDQRAYITLNSYPEQNFEGKVTEIIPQTKTTSSGATIVIARINLGNPNIAFVSGLNGQASIITSVVKNTLTIPQESLVDDTYVLLKDQDEVKKVKIEVGLFSDTNIEIKSGLGFDQTIIKNPSAYKKPSKNPFLKLLER